MYVVTVYVFIFTVYAHVEITDYSTNHLFFCLPGKRTTVLPAELKEFKEQSECLNLLQPFHFNPETGMNIIDYNIL